MRAVEAQGCGNPESVEAPQQRSKRAQARRLRGPPVPAIASQARDRPPPNGADFSRLGSAKALLDPQQRTAPGRGLANEKSAASVAKSRRTLAKIPCWPNQRDRGGEDGSLKRW